MNRELLQQALDALNTCNWDYDSEEESYKTFDEDLVNAAAAALEAELAKQEFYPDWDMIKPFHDRIKELEEQLAKPEHVKPADLLVETYSSNWGAFKMNADRGVKITHKPTGIFVHCESERSQHANRKLALQELEAKLAKHALKPEQEPEVRWFQQFGDAPPRKEWVGLTDDEHWAIANTKNKARIWFVWETEAKLKELNK